MESYSERARKINELNDRIHEAFKQRDRSREHRERWSAACAEFHRRYDSLAFSACYDLDGGLKARAQSAIDASIAFLVADPYYFRSGYTKEYIWRSLPSCPIDDSQMELIEMASMRYLERKTGREFWYMCRAMCRIGRASFWSRVKTATDSLDPEHRQRAELLFEYSKGVHHGQKLRVDFQRKWRMEKFGRR
jgi:hypothetical protein